MVQRMAQRIGGESAAGWGACAGTWHMMMIACATTSAVATTVSASRWRSWPL